MSKQWKPNNYRTFWEMLLILLFLGAAQLSLPVLPPGLAAILRLALTVCWVVFLGTIILFFLLQVIFNFRFERSYLPQRLKLHKPPTLKKYRLLNPLEVLGEYRKAQLHTHSRYSYDSKITPEKLIESYRKDGYSFLAITDHDRMNDFSRFSNNEILILPGIEETVPVLWPIPLGKHLLVINPLNKFSWSSSLQKRLNQKNGSILIPAHLSWRGGAGTGRWFPQDLLRLTKLRFIEIASPHSRDPVDLTIWHKLNLKNGPKQPVWGLAVDDSHNGSNRKGWILVKTEHIDKAEFINALYRGAFYATSGPSMEVTTTGRVITVETPERSWIRFINALNQVIAVSRSDRAEYETQGDEGFIRVEVVDQRGKTAWSPPLWLVSEE